MSQECSFLGCKVRELSQSRTLGCPLSNWLETEAEPWVLILVSKKFCSLVLSSIYSRGLKAWKGEERGVLAGAYSAQGDFRTGTPKPGLHKLGFLAL